MDLNLISIFQAVAEAASFSEAAKKLGVRRSSISRSVAALERDLKVQLFNRTTRSLALTTAGTALLAKVRPQLLALEAALGSLPEREEEPSGELRLTAPGDIGAVILPAIIAGFSLRFPAVQVDVRLTNRTVDLVGEGFDLAIRADSTKLDDSSLVARRISAMELHVYASPLYLARAGTPRSPEDALLHDWVTFRGFRAVAGMPKKKPRVVGDDMLFVHRMLREGAGLGLVPCFLAQADLATGSLVRVLPKIEVKTGGVYLLHPPAQHVPRKVTAFRDYVLQHLAQHPLAPR